MGTASAHVGTRASALIRMRIARASARIARIRSHKNGIARHSSSDDCASAHRPQDADLPTAGASANSGASSPESSDADSEYERDRMAKARGTPAARNERGIYYAARDIVPGGDGYQVIAEEFHSGVEQQNNAKRPAADGKRALEMRANEAAEQRRRANNLEAEMQQMKAQMEQMRLQNERDRRVNSAVTNSSCGRDAQLITFAHDGEHDAIALLFPEPVQSPDARLSKAFEMALCEASMHGRDHVVTELLTKGKAALFVEDDEGCGLAHMEDHNGFTPFMLAAKGGHTQVMRSLKSEGAEVHDADAYGRTSLMLAAEGGRVDAIKLLREWGVAIDRVDALGRTALTYAAGAGHAAAIAPLVAMGAVVERVEGAHHAPLMLSVAGGHLAAMQVLKEKGAQLDAATEEGETAFMAAAEAGQSAAVSWLSASGATSVNAVDCDGRTALDRAVDAECSMTLTALLRSGAKVTMRALEDVVLLRNAPLLQTLASHASPEQRTHALAFAESNGADVADVAHVLREIASGGGESGGDGGGEGGGSGEVGEVDYRENILGTEEVLSMWEALEQGSAAAPNVAEATNEMDEAPDGDAGGSGSGDGSGGGGEVVADASPPPEAATAAAQVIVEATNDEDGGGEDGGGEDGSGSGDDEKMGELEELEVAPNAAEATNEVDEAPDGTVVPPFNAPFDGPYALCDALPMLRAIPQKQSDNLQTIAAMEDAPRRGTPTPILQFDCVPQGSSDERHRQLRGQFVPLVMGAMAGVTKADIDAKMGAADVMLVVYYLHPTSQEWVVVSGATLERRTGHVSYLAVQQKAIAKHAIYSAFDDKPWSGRGLGTLLVAILKVHASPPLAPRPPAQVAIPEARWFRLVLTHNRA
jgi:hypothetical protein